MYFHYYLELLAAVEPQQSRELYFKGGGCRETFPRSFAPSPPGGMLENFILKKYNPKLPQ